MIPYQSEPIDGMLKVYMVLDSGSAPFCVASHQEGTGGYTAYVRGWVLHRLL